MEVDWTDYQFRCELRGHQDDVRGICVCGNKGMATSSRDKTIRFWTPDPADKRKYVFSKILMGHTSFVGPLAWISPNVDYPLGRIVSGGMDTRVLVWDLKNAEKVHTLEGHKLQVTGIALDDRDIVSCSIDCTLRRWRDGQLVESWEAHKAAVQTVIKLPSGELVTGSSDTTLKLWRGKTCLRTFAGHTDTVRGLAVMSDLGILSASHDGSLKLWAVSGEMLMEMVGHTAIVYSVDSHASGLIVSGGEDRYAKIWKDGICVQSIEHPGCVWDVKFLEDGDIVTACSDGVVRIWTVNQDNVADQLERDLLILELSEYKSSRKRVGGLKLDELPGLEALKTPGTSDGQTKVVREGDNGVAYAWNMGEQKWDKIGEVVDGPDDTNCPIFEGIQYDYVFDVDIGDGLPIRKLPYNRSDNPYEAADKWLLKENLHPSFREQIVQFILQNTGQKDIGFDASFHDPYTGSSAYVPGQPSSSASAGSPYKHIPKKGMLFFDTAQFDGILKKIAEFNNTLITRNKQKLVLTEPELSQLEGIVKILKDTSHYHSSKFAEADIAFLMKLIRSWPLNMLFPVIDILKMVVLHPDGSDLLLKLAQAGDNDKMMELIKTVTINPIIPANTMTTIRVVTNLFKNPSWHGWLFKYHNEILEYLLRCHADTNKSLHLSFSTLLVNYALLTIEMRDSEAQFHVLQSCQRVLGDGEPDADSQYRCFVAIGTMMLAGLIKQTAVEFEIKTHTARARENNKEAKVLEVAADIELVAKDVVLEEFVDEDDDLENL